MARVEYKSTPGGIVERRNGDKRQGVTITHTGTAPFAASTGATVYGGPLTTNIDGEVPGWLDPGDYTTLDPTTGKSVTFRVADDATVTIARLDAVESDQAETTTARGAQALVFSTPLAAVNAANGETVNVGTLTANTSVPAPTNPAAGQRLRFVFTQDATGGRRITAWHASFVNPPVLNFVASAVTVAEFVYNGAAWLRVGGDPSADHRFDGGVTISEVVSLSGPVTAQHKYRLTARQNPAIDYPVAYLEPVQTDSHMSLDIGPSGTPTNKFDNGVAHVDLVDASRANVEAGNWASLRLAIALTDGTYTRHVEVGSRADGTNQQPMDMWFGPGQNGLIATAMLKLLASGAVKIRAVGSAGDQVELDTTSVQLGGDGSAVILGKSSAALATNATEGFPRIPTCAGIPTGTPASHGSTVPLIWNSVGLIMYVYASGAWHPITETLAVHDIALSDDGQAGLLVPTGTGWYPSRVALVANKPYYIRFRTSRDTSFTFAAFYVSAASGSPGNVEVAIYDSTCSTKLATTGAVAGLLNAGTGIKSTGAGSLTYTCLAGTTYVLGFQGSVAATVGMATWDQAVGLPSLFGTSFPAVRIQDGAVAALPMPSAPGAAPGLTLSACPFVALRES